MTAKRPVNVIEFDYLSKAELHRILKWCNTCCFKPYSTQIDDKGYRILFQSRQDADLFIMRYHYLFDDRQNWETVCVGSWGAVDSCELLWHNKRSFQCRPAVGKHISLKRSKGGSHLWSPPSYGTICCDNAQIGTHLYLRWQNLP